MASDNMAICLACAWLRRNQLTLWEPTVYHGATSHFLGFSLPCWNPRGHKANCHERAYTHLYIDVRICARPSVFTMLRVLKPCSPNTFTILRANPFGYVGACSNWFLSKVFASLRLSIILSRVHRPGYCGNRNTEGIHLIPSGVIGPPGCPYGSAWLSEDSSGSAQPRHT